MIAIISWIVFGLLVGLIAKAIHPGDEPMGCLSTIAIGISGSFVGGLINWILQPKAHFSNGGFLMSILGGIICCVAWRWYSLKTATSGPKNFFTGKKSLD